MFLYRTCNRNCIKKYFLYFAISLFLIKEIRNIENFFNFGFVTNIKKGIFFMDKKEELIIFTQKNNELATIKMAGQ